MLPEGVCKALMSGHLVTPSADASLQVNACGPASTVTGWLDLSDAFRTDIGAAMWLVSSFYIGGAVGMQRNVVMSEDRGKRKTCNDVHFEARDRAELATRDREDV